MKGPVHTHQVNKLTFTPVNLTPLLKLNFPDLTNCWWCSWPASCGHNCQANFRRESLLDGPEGDKTVCRQMCQRSRIASCKEGLVI